MNWRLFCGISRLRRGGSRGSEVVWCSLVRGEWTALCPCHELLVSFASDTATTTTTTLHPFNGLFSRTTWYQQGRTSLDLNEARGDGVLGCSGISWTICNQSAPRCRQITTPTPHHSVILLVLMITRGHCNLTFGRALDLLKSNVLAWICCRILCSKILSTTFIACSNNLIPL